MSSRAEAQWADRAAEELRSLGSLSDKTFRGIVRDMDRLSDAELRALVTTLLVFGPEPVAVGSRHVPHGKGPAPRPN